MSALPKEEVNEPAWLAAVRHQVETLRFGVVQIVVHDGHVVQIEKTEKLRIEKTELTNSAKKGQDHASIS
jgi:hypothetical protein